jgi:hypothetical protein
MGQKAKDQPVNFTQAATLNKKLRHNKGFHSTQIS